MSAALCAKSDQFNVLHIGNRTQLFGKKTRRDYSIEGKPVNHIPLKNVEILSKRVTMDYI